jgi:hypothetical protein
MEDTTQAARRLAREIVMRKTVEQRILMCAEMYEEAKEFAKIGMPDGLSREERETIIFERIQGAKPEQLV